MAPVGARCDLVSATERRARFGQLAVSPEHQGRGIGSSLIAEVERRSKRLEQLISPLIPLNRHCTSSTTTLVGGYRVVEHAQWTGKTYRSLIMSKRLS